MLFLPTCVGLRYGRLAVYLGAFPVSVGSVASRPIALGITSRGGLEADRADLPTRSPYQLAPGIQCPVDLPFCVPPSRPPNGTGMLTCCPSATPFGLTLGPD